MCWDQQSEIRRSKRYCSCVSRTPPIRIFPLRDLAASASTAVRDPPIIRSIMSMGGSLGTLDCKQQIDELICHLVWKETGFSKGGRGGIHFPNPNEPINLSTLLGRAPTEGSGVCVELSATKKKTLFLFFSTLFACPPPSLPPNHPTTPPLSSVSAVARSLLPKCLRVRVFLLLFCNAAHVCFSVWRRERNGFYCSALMVFCV